MEQTTPITYYQTSSIDPLFLLVLLFGLIFFILIAFSLLKKYRRAMRHHANQSHTNTLSAERQKILQLLEEGKITAQESVELLEALHESSSPKHSAEHHS